MFSEICTQHPFQNTAPHLIKNGPFSFLIRFSCGIFYHQIQESSFLQNSEKYSISISEKVVICVRLHTLCYNRRPSKRLSFDYHISWTLHFHWYCFELYQLLAFLPGFSSENCFVFLRNHERHGQSTWEIRRCFQLF